MRITKSQKETILELLKQGNTITQLDAARMNRPILRLGAIIYNLRQDGYNIVDVNKGKKRYSRYKLARRK